MSNIINHIEENPQETQRLLGLKYDQLQQLIQNAERLHQEKQALLEEKKSELLLVEEGVNINYLTRNR